MQKSNKASISACARAIPPHLLSSVPNMHLKAFVKCKFAGCNSANINPHAELWSTSFPRHGKNFHLSPGRRETGLQGGRRQTYNAFRQMWNDSNLCTSVINFHAQISNSDCFEQLHDSPRKAAQRSSPNVAVHVEQISLTHPSLLKRITLILIH